MWIVEVNVLGRRFTRRVPHDRTLRLAPRRLQSRLSQLLHPRAAA